MEVNKDEALRCLDIARRHLLTGNFVSARKFGQKSISLFPTPDAKAFISLVDAKEAAAANSNKTSSSAASSPGPSTSSSIPKAGAAPNLNRSKSTPIPDHKPAERDYTPEQAAAVKTVRSSGGDFYKVLGVKKDATDVEIKKAYRKLALQMHPDKNGAPGADEAFKIVSKAFTVLSDPQKRAIFDQHGPEDGRSSGVNYDRARPSAQQYYSRGTGGVYGEEISPEDLFNIFFGGGGFGGSFQSGYRARSRAQQTQYHQARQEHFRRQHQQQRQQRQQSQNNQDLNLGTLIQLLPLIILIIVSVTSGLFGSESSAKTNPALSDFSLRLREPFTTPRHTTQRNVPYYVDEVRFMNTYFPGQQFEFKSPSSKQINVKPDHVTLQGRRVGRLFQRMEENVEAAYLKQMQEQCRNERRRKEVARNKAMGFWGADPKLWQEAQKMTTPSCDIVKEKYARIVL
ncbi:hypothetical protein FBU30_005926 [Linnemannia zychae]|nr:hypothetical protein FBU30_005926 [Linnemannia zychae]